jgi:glycosyltransferase involved in cell wall biosynthesis
MKICIYGYSLVTPGGGTTQHTHALGSALVKAGHEVTIVTRKWYNAVSTTGELKYDFISMDSGTSVALRNIQYTLRSTLYFLHHRDDYDLIHCMSGFQSFAILAAFIRRCVKTPMVYSVLSPFRYWFCSTSFDQVICVSRNIEQRFRGPNSIYIPPFIETERFKTDSQYELGAGLDFMVGTMGYPVFRKGIRYLVESIPLILERFPKTLFLLAIDLPAIPYIKQLSQEKRYIEDTIKRERLEENVRILGAVDVPEFLNSLDIFVYPVQTTTGMIDIPPTVLECLAAGCGLVTSPQGGISEVVQDRHNGLLVPYGEKDRPRAYADRIIELMENRSLLEKVRKNGPPSVVRFDVKKILPQILQVYGKIVSGKGII